MIWPNALAVWHPPARETEAASARVPPVLLPLCLPRARDAMCNGLSHQLGADRSAVAEMLRCTEALEVALHRLESEGRDYSLQYHYSKSEQCLLHCCRSVRQNTVNIKTKHCSYSVVGSGSMLPTCFYVLLPEKRRITLVLVTLQVIYCR